MIAPTAKTADPLEEALRRYLATGDEEALESIVRGTRPRLLAVARRIGAPQDAEDAVQSAYLSLVRKRGETMEAPVVPWLVTAVIRIAYRRKAVDARQTEIARLLAVPGEGRTPPAADPGADAMGAEEAERLRREVDRLPAKYRDPVVLHHLHGLPTAEVGRLLEIPDATVRTRLRRARSLLRSRLPAGLALGLLLLPWMITDAAKGAGGALGMAAAGGVMTTGGAIGIGLAAVGIGVFVGMKFLGGAGPAADPGAEAAALAAAAKAKEELRLAAAAHAGELEGLRREVETLRGRTAAAEEEAKALRERVEGMEATEETHSSDPAGAAAATPTPKPAAAGSPFSFGEYDAALRQVDWKSVGESTRAMVPLITELREAMAKGGDFPLETAGKIQQHNAALIQAAAKIQGRIPGSGINGSYTHPAFMVNAMAATLEAAGMPMTDAQAEAIGRLGRDFTDRDRARVSAYDERTLALQKVLDEADLKDRFFEQAFALLEPRQRETLSPAATRGLLSLDLFSSGLMLAQHVLPLHAKDRDGFLTQVEQAFVDRAGFPADRREDLRVQVRNWGADLPQDWFTKETETIMGIQPVLNVTAIQEFGRRQLALFRRVVDDMGLTEEAARGTRTTGVVVVPVIRE